MPESEKVSEAVWESDVEVEYVDCMFDDPDRVDPDEAEALARLDIEGSLVLEGQLQAVLAAGVTRVDRVLKELFERRQPREGEPSYRFSPAAAPLIALGDALDCMLRELRGEARGHMVEYYYGEVFQVARTQLGRLVELGYSTPAAVMPRMHLDGVSVRGATGREAIGEWWRVSGLALTAYLDAHRGMIRELQVEDRALLRAKWASAETELDTRRMLDEERMMFPVAANVDEWFHGGALRLMGLQYGFSLVRGEWSAPVVEVGIRDLVKLLSAGRVPVGEGVN